MLDFIDIKTNRLTIQKFSPEFLSQKYLDWLNDAKVVKYSEQRHRRHTLDSCKKYYESFEGSDNLFLAIVANETELGHIGNITVVVDEFNLVADIAIMVGERTVWGKGYGSEAWHAVMNYMLEKSGMRKVTAGTMSINYPMLGVIKHSGMIVEGSRKGQFIVDGKEVDMIMAASWSSKTKI